MSSAVYSPDRLPVPRGLIEPVVIAVGLVFPAVALATQPAPQGIGHVDPPMLLSIVVGVPIVLLRRGRPITMLLVALTATVAFMAATSEPTPLIGAVLISLYTVADRTGRRTELAVGLPVLAVWYAATTLIVGKAPAGPEGFALLAWSAMAVAMGDATRSRRQYVEAVEERMRTAETERERDAQQRVVEERLRIARELHDVVAHHLAVINVQAGAAEHLAQRDPVRAAEAMGVVRMAASSVLDELGALLHLLRNSDDDHLPVDPLPTLGDLDDLLDSVTAAGLTVTTDRRGLDEPLPEAVQLLLYRIIQEALTNAAKHGTGTAHLSAHRHRDRLDLRITNQTTGHRDPTTIRTGSALGLTGMRERVAALGGTLRVGDEGNQFEIAVELPVPVGAQPQDAR